MRSAIVSLTIICVTTFASLCEAQVFRSSNGAADMQLAAGKRGIRGVLARRRARRHQAVAPGLPGWQNGGQQVGRSSRPLQTQLPARQPATKSQRSQPLPPANVRRQPVVERLSDSNEMRHTAHRNDEQKPGEIAATPSPPRALIELPPAVPLELPPPPPAVLVTPDEIVEQVAPPRIQQAAPLQVPRSLSGQTTPAGGKLPAANGEALQLPPPPEAPLPALNGPGNFAEHSPANASENKPANVAKQESAASHNRLRSVLVPRQHSAARRDKPQPTPQR